MQYRIYFGWSYFKLIWQTYNWCFANAWRQCSRKVFVQHCIRSCSCGFLIYSAHLDNFTGSLFINFIMKIITVKYSDWQLYHQLKTHYVFFFLQQYKSKWRKMKMIPRKVQVSGIRHTRDKFPVEKQRVQGIHPLIIWDYATTCKHGNMCGWLFWWSHKRGQVQQVETPLHIPLSWHTHTHSTQFISYSWSSKLVVQKTCFFFF